MILGIETSCDDTSVAIINQAHDILSNVVSSQEKEHTPFGGVVPELASRAHLENIETVYNRALQKAGLKLKDIQLIAVTIGPGLIGSLLVGLNFAKGLALNSHIPLVGVNHIRGHIEALFLEHKSIQLPALALIVSGGHTHLFSISKSRFNTLLVKTRDDAAGEAFDKLSKMLGLGFPGGAIVDHTARKGDPEAYAFSLPRMGDGSLDYSFSGMKTAALRIIEREPHAFANPQSPEVANLCASYQKAVVRQLTHRVQKALDKSTFKSILVGGGVACNSALRQAFGELSEKNHLPAYLTRPSLSTDNAAMIAAEGLRLMIKGEVNRSKAMSCGPDISLKAYDGYTPLHLWDGKHAN
ncbi:MAG: tRNA (adenosine(37)-N6)-threonylcarbamoyltransferase complex transferase subunit TsaD [Acidobacteria bacterium]|nr:MAG: tRNA (adenosine(37)-N6)-threonylcarbamoyltransferase complex transferase subunit TsaD [Acidobacteriota bacterium]